MLQKIISVIDFLSTQLEAAILAPCSQCLVTDDTVIIAKGLSDAFTALKVGLLLVIVSSLWHETVKFTLCACMLP